MGKHSSSRRVWRKVLYEKQPFPDNFSGPEFLKELRKNVTAETYEFGQAVGGSCVLMTQMNVIGTFVLCFGLVDSEMLHWLNLLIVSAVSSMIGFCLVIALTPAQQQRLVLVDNVKTVVAFFAFGYGMSPIFRTLTETISTDTIYAMSSVMFIVSLVFHDYGVEGSIGNTSLSTNLAMAATICLVSRLPSSNHSFCLLTWALILFAQWPYVRQHLIGKCPGLYPIGCLLLSPCTFIGCCLLAPLAAVFHLLLHVFICLVCPALLMIMQPSKSTIHGPWDEAVIGAADRAHK